MCEAPVCTQMTLREIKWMQGNIFYKAASPEHITAVKGKQILSGLMLFL